MSLLILFSAISLSLSDQILAGSVQSEFSYYLDDGYPIGNKIFGNIAGVDIDKDDNVVIFHRGSHTWDQSTFDLNGVYLPKREGPIPEETVVTIDPIEKRVVRSWGRDLFYMPHGLSFSQDSDYVWLTDVGLHQVFKYPADGSKQILALGTPFIPGNDENHFCKPTSVADTGEFVFVADGYCNSRIVLFSKFGKYLGEFGQSSEQAMITNPSIPTFSVPHKIVYAKEANMLCVADRENGRVQCFSFEPNHNSATETWRDSPAGSTILNGAIKSKFTIENSEFNNLVFSLDYNPIRGGIIVLVSGADRFSNKPALGFVYNVTTGQMISKFSPGSGKTFGMAHDVAISGQDASNLFVVDIAPINLWKFSKRYPHNGPHPSIMTNEVNQSSGHSLHSAMSYIPSGKSSYGFVTYLLLISIVVTILILVTKTRRFAKSVVPKSSNTFQSLYNTEYPASIASMFGTNRSQCRTNGHRVASLFSRRGFFKLFDRRQQQQNDFSRIPLEDSENSNDDGDSDSDIEEFNINQTTNVKINV